MREEELRRDLHDSIGPTLTGPALQLIAVCKLVARNKREDAEGTLARLEQRTEETTYLRAASACLGRLGAHSIYPPAVARMLDEGMAPQVLTTPGPGPQKRGEHCGHH
jgi:hypothetical protein